jgi:hypothetical protein
MVQDGRSRVRFQMKSLDFLTDLILPTALWPWGRLRLWQKWVPGNILWVKGGLRVRLTILPPSVSRLSRENVGASTSHNPVGLHGLYIPLFYLYFTALSVSHSIWRPVARRLVNNGLELTWKEVVVVYGICPDGLRKETKIFSCPGRDSNWITGI